VITAASDGACSGNPGPGGWGALIRFDDGTLEEFGGHEPSTTNNRMELIAALEILTRLRGISNTSNIQLKTDSQYLINGYTKWLSGWKRNGWKTSSGKPVLNQDLWKKLDSARIENLELVYVKGHSGELDNERVDEIAVSFSKMQNITLNKRKEKLNLPKNIKSEISNSSRNLITRLDLVDHIERKGYLLNTNEISEVLDIPKQVIKKNGIRWTWRNWSISNIDNHWKISKNDHPNTNRDLQ
tara:strand:+ start:11768 stop:12493 length:726 start_codon:yes stop_codon:yes gene_type:complete